MKRIFIAINLPESIKAELAGIEKEIAGMFSDELAKGMFKWVKPENLHITLLFIGDVQDNDIPQVCQIVEKSVQDLHGFSINFKKVCYGPPKKIPPRLMWLELERKAELTELAETLKQEITKTGTLKRIRPSFAPAGASAGKDRPFSAHITLARIRAWQWAKIEPEERPDIERELDLECEVKSVDVMESKLRRSGAEYSILFSGKL